MSSNIRVQRICQHCTKEFTAKTTVTQYCSDLCAKRAYKARAKAAKIAVSNLETESKRSNPIDLLKIKEYLTAREAALLLDCSVRSIYYYIENDFIKAVNLGQRITRIKRTDIEDIFNQTKCLDIQQESLPKTITYAVSDCYHLKEIQEKFGISEKGLSGLIKRECLFKIKHGKFVYVPKGEIEKLLL